MCKYTRMDSGFSHPLACSYLFFTLLVDIAGFGRELSLGWSDGVFGRLGMAGMNGMGMATVAPRGGVEGFAGRAGADSAFELMSFHQKTGCFPAVMHMLCWVGCGRGKVASSVVD